MNTGNDSLSLALVALVGVALFAACDAQDDSGPTSAQRFCTAAANGAAEDPLLADCASVAGILNDGYLDSAAGCTEAGGGAVDCLASEVGALAPSDAHRALAASFCSECALGVNGCEDLFFADGDDDTARAGAVVVPLSDAMAQQIQSECTAGLTCAATFWGCAQSQIASAGLPSETAECLVSRVFLGGEDCQ